MLFSKTASLKVLYQAFFICSLPLVALSCLVPRPVPSLHPPPPAIAPWVLTAGTNQLSLLKHSPDALPDEVVRYLIILLTEQDWEQPGSKYSENRYVFGMFSAKTPNSVRFSDFRNHWKPCTREYWISRK